MNTLVSIWARLALKEIKPEDFRREIAKFSENDIIGTFLFLAGYFSSLPNRTNMHDNYTKEDLVFLAEKYGRENGKDTS